ncbi:MAG: glycosyltransferase [Candidatus Thioglobus sp.]|jgi:glycosyltransferase involved in cell wall biosynthesis
MKFTVLMSIYKNEDAKHLDCAMQSIWDDQDVKPDEIVLVQDGPLPDALHQKIDSWRVKLGNVFAVAILKENVGLGTALNEGLKHCSNELIARMDTDDIALPNRFEKQLAVFDNNDVDVCGAWIGEFGSDDTQINSYRRVPEHHDEVVRFAKSRSPVNHPSVMYKKEAVLRVGGYINQRSIEDYHLWVKMIIDGAKFYNIQEALVNMRTGSGQLEVRRGGLHHAKIEAGLQTMFYKMGFLSFFEFVRNVVVGFIMRVLPNKLMKMAFKLIRRL